MQYIAWVCFRNGANRRNSYDVRIIQNSGVPVRKTMFGFKSRTAKLVRIRIEITSQMH